MPKGRKVNRWKHNGGAKSGGAPVSRASRRAKRGGTRK